MAIQGAKRGLVRLMGYGPDSFEERALEDPAGLAALRGKHPVLWVNVEGLENADLVVALGAAFGLHELALEDVLTLHQRPKVEEYGDHLYIVARLPSLGRRLESEQVSVFLGPGFVLTFQEGRPGDCFDPVRQRLRAGQGPLRANGPDHLAYALLDAMVESYFPVLEHYGSRLEALEGRITARPVPAHLNALHAVKRDLLALRRALWPLREALNWLLRETSPLVGPETRVYLRDCHDHALRILDMLETYREVASDLGGIYLSCVGHRTNEIMRVLTIISTIFIPLSFVAGIYGMNFDPDRSPLNMPELRWYWGYPFALGVMGALAAGLVGMFWRWGWLSKPPVEDRTQKT